MDKSRHIKKEAMIQALENSLGIVTTACKKTDIPRSTFYKWLNEDEEFAKKVKDIDNIALDFAESQLHNQMNEGNTSATIFYLKTKGKKRGYIEKSELDITSGDEPIKININIDGIEY
ncbi:MAG: hypothetical protein GOVbin3264_17 [Prokaryotic dsDNA virus sp.]|nr:MAG: hypothetical protein GOVbin3264_17 [Prokaryotic dsDNA virus sp.]|tara:strand:+ start:2471 stop:2824 length:354 start_codon:yes stop_codon:yes gene_type:complete